ncbi:MAG TPA: SDR family oxidoreductase [Dehalococcoidia bacterium]|nr:SDR family oxidoreductase [Dehalococcoidia bacterium]
MSVLEGKIALVTGGGRGLGEAICYALAEGGARILVADVRAELAAQVAQGVNRHSQGEALPLDVSEAEWTREAVETAALRYGRLDILVNNAGLDVTLPVEELEVADWDRIIAVNLRGPFLLSKAVLPVMKRQGEGHIVNIVSTAAKRAWANASAYHASKWGLLGFSHALHVEARPYGVKVTAVVAGGMKTPFLFERFPEIDPNVLQDPRNVAETVRFVLTQPRETVIPEIMVLPMGETSWP